MPETITSSTTYSPATTELVYETVTASSHVETRLTPAPSSFEVTFNCAAAASDRPAMRPLASAMAAALRRVEAMRVSFGVGCGLGNPRGGGHRWGPAVRSLLTAGAVSSGPDNEQSGVRQGRKSGGALASPAGERGFHPMKGPWRP